MARLTRPVGRAKADWNKLNQYSDEELLAALVPGCHDAITVLFDRYSVLIFHVAEHILRDAGEAQEVLQTVFMNVFRTSGKFDPARGSVRIWLLQHAYHGTKTEEPIWHSRIALNVDRHSRSFEFPDHSLHLHRRGSHSAVRTNAAGTLLMSKSKASNGKARGFSLSSSPLR